MILPIVTKTVPNNRHVGTEIDEGMRCNVVPIPVPMISRHPMIIKNAPIILIITSPSIYLFAHIILYKQKWM